jgi:hypothetical protein
VTRGKYYIDKRCTNMGGSKKLLNNTMKKRVLYNISKGPKFKNWIVQKMKRLKKPN